MSLSVSSPEPTRGPIISGKYRVVGLLGKGGMGTVYEAINEGIGRRVALKVIAPGLAANPEILKRFELEARAAALISHPGIVDVLDTGRTEDGSPFIVMEYLEGVTLRGLIRGMKRFSAEEASAIFCPVLDAMGAAHAAGVVHRDLKPANIFIAIKPVPAVKVLDFGISKFRTAGERVTAAGTTLGTPAFMAPEQLVDGSDVGPQADLYAVGAMLYLVLAGKPMFQASTSSELDAQVLTATPRPIRELRPDVPPALAQLIAALLQKTPAARPASARQTVELLKAAAAPAPDRMFQVATEMKTGGPPEPKTMIDLPSSLTPTGPTLDVPSATRTPGLAPPLPPAQRRPRWLVALAVVLVSFVVAWLLIAPWVMARNAARPAPAPTPEEKTEPLVSPAARVALEPTPVDATPLPPPSAEPLKVAPDRARPQTPPAKKKPLGLDKSNPYL